ncbi:hypothetical protein CCP4SC76_5180026 [Gammaproteobacteria bacterium]
MSDFFFGLNRNKPVQPTISVICINKNHGEYIEETILSVFSQKFDNFEFIIADGGSSDKSLEIIGKHKFIKLVSGHDSSRAEGVFRALAVARGRYVMFTTSTDGYLSRDWFKSVASVLDSDPQVSLVFGASATMSSEGTLGPVTYPSLFPFYGLPQKENWSSLWILNGFSGSYLPELNYCVRMDVFRQLMEPSTEFPELDDIDPILRVHFEFNRLGYLPTYLPTLANFGRMHDNQDQFSERNKLYLHVYNEAWKKYREGVLSGQRIHLLRDGSGQPFARIAL